MNIAFVVSSVLAGQTGGDFWELQYANYKYFFFIIYNLPMGQSHLLAEYHWGQELIVWKLLAVFTAAAEVLLCSRIYFSFSIVFCF